MSSRVEIVRRAFPAFADRDVNALEALMTPDVEIQVASPALGGKPPIVRRLHYAGHAGLEAWLREVREDFTDLSLEARHVEEIGDAVLVLGTVAYESAAGGGGGITIGWVCHFAGDRVARIETYWRWDAARAACGAPV
ncbi:MAG TPA: nuclear transport factor 2 family protein [Thermoleophilaceae bacterium]|nr:nuclear transport factor 2 family protein [Thermoleophilaceae bacterium]